MSESYLGHGYGRGKCGVPVLTMTVCEGVEMWLFLFLTTVLSGC